MLRTESTERLARGFELIYSTTHTNASTWRHGPLQFGDRVYHHDLIVPGCVKPNSLARQGSRHRPSIGPCASTRGFAALTCVFLPLTTMAGKCLDLLERTICLRPSFLLVAEDSPLYTDSADGHPSHPHPLSNARRTSNAFAVSDQSEAPGDCLDFCNSKPGTGPGA